MKTFFFKQVQCSTHIMFLHTVLISIFSLLYLVSGTDLNLTLHWDATERNLTCNDGSPGGYYFLAAPENASVEEKNTWIVVMEPGGWCWDEESCINRIEGCRKIRVHTVVQA